MKTNLCLVPALAWMLVSSLGTGSSAAATTLTDAELDEVVAGNTLMLDMSIDLPMAVENRRLDLSTLENFGFDPAALESLGLQPDALDDLGLDPAALESVGLDPAALESLGLDPAALESLGDLPGLPGEGRFALTGDLTLDTNFEVNGELTGALDFTVDPTAQRDLGVGDFNQLAVSGDALANANSLVTALALGDIGITANITVIIQPENSSFDINSTGMNFSHLDTALDR